jgi:aminodeoxyfutalosine synthase
MPRLADRRPGPRDPALVAIAGKLDRGERLEREDGIALFTSPDFEGVATLANAVREQKNGNAGYYVVNRHVNYSNVCVDTCLFCAFGKRKGQEGGYELSLEQIFHKTGDLEARGVRELHIVGGLHPDYPYRYYLDLVAGLKERHPGVAVKAYTAVEIQYFAELAGKDPARVLADLKAAGLDALPGGGAEMFSERVRKLICRTKIDAPLWLDIHRAAHRMGIPSNCTMLYGHVETIEERVDHILALRALQDETGGFLSYIPLAFHPENTFLAHLSKPTSEDHLRNIAAGRLLLPNVPHVKCYWIMSGIDVAQASLGCGADDVDGTVGEEKIYHMAGARTPQDLHRSMLEELIRRAGRDPVERDTFYRPVTTATTTAPTTTSSA